MRIMVIIIEIQQQQVNRRRSGADTYDRFHLHVAEKLSKS